ncbi:hypothetical protein ACET3Z_021654 [Daucus carota]
MVDNQCKAQMMSFPAYPEHAPMVSISGQNGLWKSLSSGDLKDTDTPTSQNGSPEDVSAEHKSQQPTIVEPPSTEEGVLKV